MHTKKMWLEVRLYMFHLISLYLRHDSLNDGYNLGCYALIFIFILIYTHCYASL